MRVGLLLLALAYVLSQFFRAFLAVLAAPLKADLGLSADALATASGLWFLSFAVMQLPVGWALDKIGPRLTSSVLLLIGGGGGAALFALATAPWHIHAAMLMIGIGCSPVLMASYYIFAREFPAAQFATLAALMIGVGTLGNLVASWPTAWAADVFGWRETMAGLAALSALIAVGAFVLVHDPEAPEDAGNGSLLDLLRMPALWLIFPLMFVNYAPAAAVRGLWIGPYLADVFGLDNSQVGQATLLMGIFMILGVVAYGPLDRVFGSRKWVVFVGNAMGVVMMLGLWALIGHSVWMSVALMAGAGFFGASFPVMVAHGRSFFPSALVGRGVTLMNLFGIGGVGVMQFASGRLHVALAPAGSQAQYAAIFAFFGLALVAGLAIYLFSPDRTD